MEKLIDVLIFFNVIGSFACVVLLCIRYNQTKRVINLGLIPPMLYSGVLYLGVSYHSLCDCTNPDWPSIFRLPVRILITWIILSLIIFLTSEMIAKRIRSKAYKDVIN